MVWQGSVGDRRPYAYQSPIMSTSSGAMLGHWPVARLVVLDSNQTRAHDGGELKAYAPFVPVGS